MKSRNRYLSVFTLIVMIMLSFSSKGQIRGGPSYSTGIGIRGGFSYGVSVKHFIQKNRAIEGILAYRWRGAGITGLYEFYYPTPVLELSWFFGFGAHAGYFSGYSFYNETSTHLTGNVFSAGLDGIIGIEYGFKRIPITLGFDFKPFFDIVPTGFNPLDAAVSVRYVF